MFLVCPCVCAARKGANKVLVTLLLEAIAGSSSWPITGLLCVIIMLLWLKVVLRVKLVVVLVSHHVKR
jgi:hypothetical protein